MKYLSKIIISLVLLFTLSGCGTPKLSIQEQKSFDKFGSQQIAELNDKMQRASSDYELNFYAPLSFINAQKTYKKFKKYTKNSQQRDEQYIYYIATEKYIDHGLESKEMVQSRLEKLLIQKERLLHTNAFDNFENRYEEFDEELNAIIEDIDQRLLDDVNAESSDLYKESILLYADNMSFNYLSKYTLILDTLDDEGTANNIPRQYSIARKQLNTSSKKIKADPDNKEFCTKERLKTKNQVLYAQLLANEVHALMDRSSKSYEVYLDAWHRSHEKIYLRSSTEGTILYLPRDEKVNILINSMK